MKDLLLDVLRAQLRLHDNVELQDVCKLLYQAAFGSEHLTFQARPIEKSLWKEYHHPPRFAGEEMLIEQIDPTRLVCRVNLRPYKARGGTYEVLLEAFVKSTEAMADGWKRFHKLWEAFTELVLAGELPFPSSDVERLKARYIACDRLPALRHSDAYRAANKPCYRVMRVAYIPAALAKEPA